MARGLKRVLKLLAVLVPILPVILVVNQGSLAGENHNHFIHDRIAPVPALIAETAAQNAALTPIKDVNTIVNRAVASVSAAPAGAPSDVGQWSQVYNWPLVAVHTALLPDQKVLMWDAWEFGASPSARLWDPATQSFTSVPNTTSGLFCAGQVMLPDGRQLVTGGHNGASYGINHTNIFDWQSDSWSRISNMAFDRWYPTSISLGDGRQFVLGGQADPDTYVHIPEVFNPSNNTWATLNSASIPVGNYPFIFLTPNGKVFNIVDDTGHSALLDVNNQTWTNTSV
ncbi:MAG: hypothetical protein K8I30_22060, partial [Anaerolineae bacterium]|nr:hypothetical protein [Anaerolineae bacterium]